MNEGRKEGRKEGKEGRKEGRNENFIYVSMPYSVGDGRFIYRNSSVKPPGTYAGRVLLGSTV